MQNDVEQFWQAVATKFGDNRQWSELDIQQQQVVIQGLNNILAVLHRMV
jgi:hypothetical protein